MNPFNKSIRAGQNEGDAGFASEDIYGYPVSSEATEQARCANDDWDYEMIQHASIDPECINEAQNKRRLEREIAKLANISFQGSFHANYYMPSAILGQIKAKLANKRGKNGYYGLSSAEVYGIDSPRAGLVYCLDWWANHVLPKKAGAIIIGGQKINLSQNYKPLSLHKLRGIMPSHSLEPFPARPCYKSKILWKWDGKGVIIRLMGQSMYIYYSIDINEEALWHYCREYIIPNIAGASCAESAKSGDRIFLGTLRMLSEGHDAITREMGEASEASSQKVNGEETPKDMVEKSVSRAKTSNWIGEGKSGHGPRCPSLRSKLRHKGGGAEAESFISPPAMGEMDTADSVGNGATGQDTLNMDLPPPPAEFGAKQLSEEPGDGEDELRQNPLKKGQGNAPNDDRDTNYSATSEYNQSANLLQKRDEAILPWVIIGIVLFIVVLAAILFFAHKTWSHGQNAET